MILKSREKHEVSYFLSLLLLSNSSRAREVVAAKGRLAEEVRGEQLEGKYQGAGGAQTIGDLFALKG